MLRKVDVVNDLRAKVASSLLNLCHSLDSSDRHLPTQKEYKKPHIAIATLRRAYQVVTTGVDLKSPNELDPLVSLHLSRPSIASYG